MRGNFGIIIREVTFWDNNMRGNFEIIIWEVTEIIVCEVTFG